MALCFSVLLYLILPQKVNTAFVLELYSICLTVLSIIFSIFFAASVIILSSGADDFVIFLEQVEGYSTLIWTFKYTLYVLFLALLYSLVAFGMASYSIKIEKNSDYPKFLFIIFVFLFLYGLFSTLMSTLDAYRFAHNRMRFLKIKKKKKEIEEEKRKLDKSETTWDG